MWVSISGGVNVPKLMGVLDLGVCILFYFLPFLGYFDVSTLNLNAFMCNFGWKSAVSDLNFLSETSALGEPIYVSYSAWQHYKATEWAQSENSEVAIKPGKL